MKYSKFFPKTLRQAPHEATLISNKLLIQAGFIKESSAGKYFFLPLGWRVHEKIRAIIKEEMDKAGGQEMIAPVLHPLELWEETNRTKTTGFELLVIKDHQGGKFALGGTAEEMFVDLIRKFQLSYKDLPLNLYQFSTKFRDEKRPRGGLLRVREFIMKDAYSFDKDEKSFKKSYDLMAKTYKRIFDRLGLKTVIVESDNGYIGGEYCHEFVYESEVGESKFFISEDGKYAAHEDVAKFKRYEEANPEILKPRKDIEGKGIIGVAELAKLLAIPVEKTTKTILFETDEGEVVAAAVNGIYDINEVKLKHAVGANSLELASSETVKKVTGAEVGYAGILNLPSSVRVVMDISLKNRSNFECGANKTDYHSININFGRDLPLPGKFYDIALAKEGYLTSDGKQKLIAKRGIEVGNIFQLGYHYSKKMKGADFVDEKGNLKQYYMGCYGIGIGRSMAAIVEKYNDGKGIIWPKAVAPFKVHLIDIQNNKKGDEVYNKLVSEGIEVLWDDREVSAGVKFSDADLIGVPIRLVVSVKTGDKIEWKERGKNKAELIPLADVLTRLK